MESEKFAPKEVTAKKVDNLLAISDTPVDIFASKDDLPVNKGGVMDKHHTLGRVLESENTVRKQTVEENLSDLLTCSEKLFPVDGRGKPSKISPDKLILDASGGTCVGRNGLPVTSTLAEKDLGNILSILDALGGTTAGIEGLPVTNSEEVLSRNDHSLQCSPWTLGLLDELQVVDDDQSLLSDQLHVTEKEQTATMSKADNHRLMRKLESENLVQKEAAEENMSDVLVCSGELFPVGGQRRPLKISSGGTVCCFYWCYLLPRWFANGRGHTWY